MVWWSISIKLCWYVGVFPLTFFVYVGVFPLNFGGMLEYFHKTLVVYWSISIKLWWYVGVFPLKFGGMVEDFH